MLTSLEQKVNAALVVGLAVLALVIGTALWTATRLSSSTGQVDHTREVIELLGVYFSGLQDVETGARGYVVTGDESYLDPYERAVADTGLTVAELHALTPDGGVQRERVDTLESLAAQRIGLATRLISLRREQGIEEVSQAAILDEGKAVMDQIRGVITEMTDQEHERLAAQERQNRQTMTVMYAVIAASGALAISSVAFAGFTINRQIRARQRAVDDLDRFFAVAPDMLATADFHGYFTRLNPVWSATLGWTVEELMREPYLNFVHSDDRDATLAAAARQTEEGKTVLSFENRYRCKDGSYRWLQWSSAPFQDKLFAAARDITAIRDTERALRDLNATLEQQVAERTAAAERRATELTRINAELEAFTYSVSHDLKEPLRTLEAFSGFLLEDYADRLDDDGREYLNKLGKASARMKRLIEDLLALSRIGRAPHPSAAIDVRRVVSAVAEGMRTTLDQRHASVEVDGDIPEVLADPVRIEQIFGNLIGNGIKFNPSDAPRVTIGSRGIADGRIVLYVQDNGIGIDPQYYDRIFGVFQRLHRREEYDGTGAGLAIVKRAVETLGGRIWVESEPGAGTTFLFTLPLAGTARIAA